jgi:hypothetical protein
VTPAVTPAQFWRIKAAVAEVTLAQERARQIVAPAQAVLAEAMRQAGLDPAADYRLDESTERIVPVAAGGESA